MGMAVNGTTNMRMLVKGINDDLAIITHLNPPDYKVVQPCDLGQC